MQAARNVTETVEQAFAAVAAQYAGSTVHSGGVDLDTLVAEGVERGTRRVLDVGSGPGHTALAFAPHAERVVALDLAEPMLDQGRQLAARRGIANVEFFRGDVESLDFPDASFDLVSARHCAHHFARPDRAVAECARVLAPGGSLLLVDSVAPEEAVVDTYLNALEVLRDPSHVRNHRVDEWLDWFRAAGFEGECLGRWPLRLDFAQWVGRVATPPAAVTAIRALQHAAPHEAHSLLEIDDKSGDFTLPIVLLAARRA